MIGNIDYLLEHMQKAKNFNHTKTLFGATNNSDLVLKPAKPIDDLEILQWEKELLGVYLSGHPFQKFKEALRGKIKNISEVLKLAEGMKVSIAGVVNEIKRSLTKKKEPFAYLDVEDLSDKIEVMLFPKVYEQYFEILSEGRVYYWLVQFKKGQSKYNFS